MWYCPFSIYISVIKFNCSAIGLVSSLATKAAMASPKSFTIFHMGISGRVVFKQMFSLNAVFQLVMVMIYAGFFLKLGVSLQCCRV